MTYETLRLERNGSILTVRLDHPTSRVNAIDATMHDDLDRVFAELQAESTARAVVITGRPGAFSAGGDFAWFPALRDPLVREEVRRAGRRIVWNILDLQIPLVAAVGGPAAGLGATLALLCDAAFMASDAVIGDPHVRVGLVAGDGGTAIWPALVGPMLAKRYLLTGDMIEAQEAHRLGLVSHVVAPDRLEEAALEFAQRLAEGPPLAIRYTKLAVNTAMKQAFSSAFDVALAYELATMASDDHAEAVAAAVDRRTPRFEGR